jgi:ABC-2 type transport system permease protein/capsular polysaccharide transport system permease protein
MPSSSSTAQTGALVGHSSWQIYRRVIGALFIRELLTRYGRNNIGFLWLFVEPAVFILLITLIRGFIRGAYPYLPVVAFALSGYASLLLWRNAASRVIGAVKSNKPLLYHRQVTIMDIFTARIALELMAITSTLVGLSIALWAFGWLALPEDFLQVLAGWFLLAWFAIGLALTIGALSEKADVISRIWHPFSYILMINSGAFFIVDVFPPAAREFMLWVPPLNGVEYMRDGWFGSSFTAHYDLGYFVTANFVLTFVGMILVRQLQFDSSEE